MVEQNNHTAGGKAGPGGMSVVFDGDDGQFVSAEMANVGSWKIGLPLGAAFSSLSVKRHDPADAA